MLALVMKKKYFCLYFQRFSPNILVISFLHIFIKKFTFLITILSQIRIMRFFKVILDFLMIYNYDV